MKKYTASSPRGSNELIEHIELQDATHIPKLVHNSKQAFVQWSTTSVQERVTYLKKFVQAYSDKRDYFAELISKEIGKPISQSLGDIDFDISYINYYLDNAEEMLASKIIYQDEYGRHTLHYDPKGVGVSITPWNYPTTLFIWQVIPPLLAGNTILFKPAHPCVVIGKHISELVASFLPRDVLISVFGGGDVGEMLIKENIDFIVFTGSSDIGKKISAAAAPGLKKTFLELGGSAPGIILPDANIDTAMMETISRFRRRHGGQICDGLKRLFVHRSRYDELIATFTSYLSTKKIGNPLDPSTDLGCLVNQTQYDSIQAQLLDATEKGAQLIELGIYDNTPGPFMKHTLVLHPTLDMRIMQEEVFGPVLPIMVYDTAEEAISRANSTPYGLGGYLWGNTPSQLEFVSQHLKTGNINVNNTNYVIPQVPFGGYKKESGNCREHGVSGLREYCEVKVVSMPATPAQKYSKSYVKTERTN